ncbi:synaptonemal complex protein 1 [Flavobacterium defluvii]|uniref:Outer membrane protein beta-barrel domain-containing protein n=1 Tax=Flavobacterium defluvii TaxID=370979 RepID=A0A1M5TC60_9FLAO|nr:hypothetical protein [Flavobacterium defluvii]SHH48367.1 hypothetical protein SAMN05443663_1086 [Flavobacterium defluvii]
MIVKIPCKLWTLILSTLICAGVCAQDKFEKLSDTQFKAIVNQEFGTLMASQSRSDIGNFAGLDIKEAEASFAGSIVFKNAAILGIKLDGGSADGILPIFTSTELNSKIGLQLQYSFLVRRKELKYESLSFEDVEMKKKELLRQFKLDSLLAERKVELVEQQVAEAKKKILAADSLINLYRSEHYINLQNALLRQATGKRDSLSGELENARSEKEKNQLMQMLYKQDAVIAGIKTDIKTKSEIIKMEYDRDKVKMEMSFLLSDLQELKKTDNDVFIRLGTLKERYDIEARQLENNEGDKKIIVAGYKLQWLSLGYNVKNTSFKLFNPLNSFDDQILKDHFVSHGLGLTYSFYNLSDKEWKSRFISFSIEGALEDNFSSLTKVTINEKDSFNNADDTRYGTEQYIAYTGSYRDNLETVRLNFDYYQFFLKNNFGAIHLFPQYAIKEKLKPQMNFGLGIVFSFKDKDNTSSTVNAELYYKSTDLANVSGSDKEFFKRGDLGIRLSFPIKFNTK